jgi:D-glycero-alpha-D-manno-heptose-7-phosphate kinase
MVVSSAPMRISFVGGGTDLADFYTLYPGRVLSTAIDKFVFVAINRAPFTDHVAVRYSISEEVSHPSQLRHTRVREALLDLGIENHIEISSFAPIPAKTGLGSSSTFSVALMKGLYTYLGKRVNKREVAEAACRLEIDLVKEPIGKQDQYAAAFGGFNILQFNLDGSVDIEPLLLDFRKRLDLEQHLILFFLGTTRDASSVLLEQRANTTRNFDILKRMSDSVLDFKQVLLRGDFQGMGEMLLDGWEMKKQLASSISNPVIDTLYEEARKRGAWGGKLLGAGGGGCLMLLAPIGARKTIVDAMSAASDAHGLVGAREIPVQFVQTGAETLIDFIGR